MHCTTDGTMPTAKSPVYAGPLDLSPSARPDVRAVVTQPDGRTSTISELVLTSAGQPSSKVVTP
ncbi:MAG: chitobiase/beta-hexosaminidase C-terminal domain-containing protein [Candidatus Eremiobacteraeota bacterium]|nr:chitobiase/beta-hexosaminidase C-terminal domain-containing protein [Candidatus Eremiobacteraeota bacterium]